MQNKKTDPKTDDLPCRTRKTGAGSLAVSMTGLILTLSLSVWQSSPVLAQSPGAEQSDNQCQKPGKSTAPGQIQSTAPEQSKPPAPEQSNSTAPKQSQSTAPEQSKPTAPEQSQSTAPEQLHWHALSERLSERKSPDKSETAYVLYYPTSNASHIYRASSDKKDVLVQKFCGKVESLQWLADNATVVYLAKAFQKSPLHLFSTNLKTGLTRDLTPFAFRDSSAFYTNEKATQIFALLNLEDKSIYNLYRIDTTSGAMRKIGKPPEPMPKRTIYAPTVGPTATAVSPLPAIRPIGATYRMSGHVPNYPNYDQPLAGQEALAKKYKDRMIQFFLFCPNDSVGQPPVADGKNMKVWHQGEKDQLETAIELLATRAPALILQAAHGQRIQLFRMDKTQNNSFVESIRHEGSSTYASTYGRTIVFTDEFFKGSKFAEVEALAHELTHAVDYERRLSFTSAWVQAVGRNVALLHRAAELNHEAHLPLLDDTVARYYNLPSAYSASNLTEALADSVCRYVSGSHKPSPAVLAFIDEKILTEPSEQVDNAISFQSAITLMRKEKYAQAEALFDEMAKSEPQYFSVYYYRTHACLQTGKLKKALADSDRCLAMLKSLGIPTYEDYYPYCYCERAKILSLLGRRKDALAAIDKAMALAPHDANIVTTRKRMLSGKTPFPPKGEKAITPSQHKKIRSAAR